MGRPHTERERSVSWLRHRAMMRASVYYTKVCPGDRFCGGHTIETPRAGRKRQCGTAWQTAQRSGKDGRLERLLEAPF